MFIAYHTLLQTGSLGNACNSKAFTGLANMTQSNLDYPDSLGLDEIVRIIEGLDNQKYEY